MIECIYESPKGDNLEGKLRINVHENSKNFFLEEQFPLRLSHKRLYGGGISWREDLYPGVSIEFTFITYTTLEVIDSLGNKLIDWKWDPFIHGDAIHQIFEIWSMNNIGSNGIAIGTHNGMTGEWVGPINKGLIKGLLVEASNQQFFELYKFYNNRDGIKCRKELITTDGSDTFFYEGGEGWTNSVFSKHIEKYVDLSLIKKTKRTSVSINTLIENASFYGPVRWIHLDVEGLDKQLILSIREDLLPKLLVYENAEINDEYNNMVRGYLESKGYTIHETNVNVIAIKKT